MTVMGENTLQGKSIPVLRGAPVNFGGQPADALLEGASSLCHYLVAAYSPQA
jgi:hypothetical protein